MYAINNSTMNRSGAEKSVGIFPAQRRSLGANSPKPDRNAKAGTFAFGTKVESGRSITVKPELKSRAMLGIGAALNSYST